MKHEDENTEKARRVRRRLRLEKEGRGRGAPRGARRGQKGSLEKAAEGREALGTRRGGGEA